jgi:hypothetical protein
MRRQNYINLFLLVLGFSVTAALILLPHFKIQNLQSEKGIGIVYTPSYLNGYATRFDDQVKLLPSLQLARKGVLTGKAGNKEYQDELYPNVLQESVVAFIYAPIIFLTDSSDSPYYFLGVLVGMSYLVGFYLCRFLGVDRFFAFSLPIIMIFGYYFFAVGTRFVLPKGLLHPEYLLTSVDRIRDWTDSRPYELNSFYRIHTLGASYAIFLGYVYSLIKSLKTQQNVLKDRVVLGLILGLQFYCYVFYAIAAAASLIIIAIWFLLCGVIGNGDNYRRSYSLFISGLIGFLIAIPSMLETLGLLGLLGIQGHADWLSRIGGDTITGKPFWANSILYGLTLYFLLFSRGALRLTAISLLIPVMLMSNSGVIFGKELQPGHLYIRTVMPVMVLLVGCSLYIRKFNIFSPAKFISAYRLLLRGMVLVLASFFVFNAISYSGTYAKHTYKHQGVTIDQKELHDWLKDKPELTVATLSPEIGMPLNMHTPVYLYLTFSGHLHNNISNEDIDNRLVNIFWLFNIDITDLESYFDQHNGLPFERRYHYYYWQRRFGYPRYGDDFTAHLEALEKKLIDYDPSLESGLCHNDFDYLVVDSSRVRQRELSNLRMELLRLEVVFGDIKVYRFLPSALDCKLL